MCKRAFCNSCLEMVSKKMTEWHDNLKVMVEGHPCPECRYRQGNTFKRRGRFRNRRGMRYKQMQSYGSSSFHLRAIDTNKKCYNHLHHLIQNIVSDLNFQKLNTLNYHNHSFNEILNLDGVYIIEYIHKGKVIKISCTHWLLME